VDAGAWTSEFTWLGEAFESVDLEAACGSGACGDAIGHTTPNKIAAKKSNLEEFPNTSL